MINRPVQLSVTTTGSGFQELAPFRILFTGDISCKPANSGPVLFQIDGVEVAWDPGEWHTFHHIDLLLIQVSGNAGDIVTCIGDTFAPASAGGA
jgi:hypothetical protein